MPVCVVYILYSNNMFIELKTRRGYAHIVYILCIPTQYTAAAAAAELDGWMLLHVGPSDRTIGIGNTEKSI